MTPTATVQHRDRPPTPGGQHPEAPAGARSRQAMLALAAVESRRLLRHPAVLAAAAFGAVLLWSSGQHIVPVLSRSDTATQLPLAPLAAATLLATNLAALRAHRDGADDLYGATRLSVAWRTLAHLLSVPALVALAGALVAADLAWLAWVPGRSGAPNPAELATGPALIALFGCLGVLLGRVRRSVTVAPLALAGLAVGSYALNLPGFNDRPVAWLGALRVVHGDPWPAALLGRPAAWHAAYLLGGAAAVGALAVGLAVWRGQARALSGRRAHAVTATVLVAALAATATAAVAQTRPPSPAVAARRVAAAGRPATQQVCQRRGPAVYCVFPGFQPQISLWEPVVRAVLGSVPPAVTAAAPPVVVAQRIDLGGLTLQQLALALAQRKASRGQPVAPVGTAWGRSGRALGASQSRLAGAVAARIVGLPAPKPPEQPPTRPGEVQLESPAADARAVVALWLAAQAGPQAAAELRRRMGQVGIVGDVGEAFSLTDQADWDDPAWGGREGQYALALLDRPAGQVRATLRRNWALLTSPATTLARLAEVFGLQPPPQPGPHPFDDHKLQDDQQVQGSKIQGGPGRNGRSGPGKKGPGVTR
jgi:hypothetical protein